MLQFKKNGGHEVWIYFRYLANSEFYKLGLRIEIWTYFNALHYEMIKAILNFQISHNQAFGFQTVSKIWTKLDATTLSKIQTSLDFRHLLWPIADKMKE